MKQKFKSTFPDLVRLVRLINYELHGWAVDLSGRVSIRQRALLNDLKTRRHLRLNIASGQAAKPGWINIDVSPAADIRRDLRRKLPLADQSVELIFCEHFCDHLSFPNEISRFLAECHRVLESGGTARFVLHDADGLMRAAIDRDHRYFEVAEMVMRTPMESVNMLFRFNDFHQFMYDFDTFEMLLKDAGFSKIAQVSYLKSARTEIVLDVEHPSREIMSMYIEAEK